MRIAKKRAPIQDQARKVNQKKRRRRRKRNYILYYILILFLVVVIGVTLSITVFFNVETIEVSETENYTSDEIIAYAGVEIGDNLFRMNLQDIEDAIMNRTTDLDKVVVERKLPDTLSIRLTPSTPMAVVAAKEGYYILSSGARVMSVVPILDGYESLFLLSGLDLNQVQVGDFVDGNEEYRTVKQILEAISDSGLESIRSLELGDGNDIRLSYEGRVTILLGNILEIDHKLQMAKQILAEKVGETEEGILDVADTSTAYFRQMSLEDQQKAGYVIGSVKEEDASSQPEGTDVTEEPGTGEESFDETEETADPQDTDPVESGDSQVLDSDTPDTENWEELPEEDIAE